MKLELVEPWLGIEPAPDALARFAAAISRGIEVR
jgi:hypothetical protein